MQKQQFLDQAQSMGMDLFEVQDFLESKGLAEYNMNIILDQLHNQGFVNVLTRGQM